MPTSRPTVRALALCLVAAVANPQTIPAPPPPIHKPAAAKPSQPPFNPNVIFLDPAHGGADLGARLDEDTLEKDATVAFAKRLRELLTARGFTVILTHESAAIPAPPPPPSDDPDAPPTPPYNPAANNPSADQRVEQANRSRAVACIILHASNGGHGIHLYTSALTPIPPQDPATLAQDAASRPIIPWDTAQAPSIDQSVRLTTDLATALNGIRVPLVTGHVSIRPIDSMTCPAIALELSPLTSGESQIPASDPPYQQRVAEAVAAGLDSWRGHAQAQLAASQAFKEQAARDAAKPAPPKPAAPPAPKSKPKSIPQENPVTVTPDTPAAPRKPAPIIRKDPAANPAPPPQPPAQGSTAGAR